MLLLTSYMDETGHSEDPKFHFAGMAGFVAPTETWISFGKVWQEILDIFQLKEFHAKEFAHSAGQFKDWKGKETKRRLLYCALVTMIVKSHAIPVGAIVSLEDFRSLTAEQQSHFKDPYYVAFQTCTRGAAIQSMALTPPEKVAMIYAYNQQFGAVAPKEVYSVDQAGHAEQLWHVMQATTDFGQWMTGYGSSTPRDTVQLQAADLFAYELAKEFENLLTRPKDDMRWGLRQILKAHLPFHFIQLFDRKELLRIIKQSNWPDQSGVEELDDLQMISAHRRMLKWVTDQIGIEHIEDDI
jgi:hypothetical protein